MNFSSSHRWTALGVSVAIGVSALQLALRAVDEKPTAVPRVFEMRTYVTHDGRLDALHRRFREHTTKLFEKHGMTNVGYWTPLEAADSKNTLVYLLAYPSRDAREASWKAFLSDPEWKAVQSASEKDGPIVREVISKLLSGTDYSAIR